MNVRVCVEVVEFLFANVRKAFDFIRDQELGIHIIGFVRMCFFFFRSL